MDIDKIVKIISRTISFCLISTFLGFFYLESKGHIYSDGFDLLGHLGIRAGGIIKEKSLYSPNIESLPEQEWTDSALQMTDDVFLGNKDADIKMYVFSSFDCPACSLFHNEILPDIKKEYVDTNKVALVFKDFPLRKIGLAATELSKCISKNVYYDFVDKVMKSQGAFLYSKAGLEVLKNYAKDFGLTEAEIDTCLDNEELKDRIIYLRKKASIEYNITSTPTIIIKSKDKDFIKIVGAKDFSKFKQAFDNL